MTKLIVRDLDPAEARDIADDLAENYGLLADIEED